MFFSRQTVFAACVPEMFRLFQNRERYKDDYKDSYGNRHVVVAGDISTSSMDWFLNSFYSIDRENNKNLHVVFVNRCRKLSSELDFSRSSIFLKQTFR